MEKQQKTKKKGRAVKPVILAACVAVVGLSVYADWSYSQKKNSETAGSYIYNSAVSGEKAKILGEATYVGATSDSQSAEVVSETSSNVGNLSENTNIAESVGYFSSAALERQRSRDETLELLQTVVDSSESMPDAKNKALEDMTVIAAAMEAETNIETLIRAKGFEDCIAVVSDENVNIIVKTAGLLTYEVAQIQEIVMKELGVSAENITIIEKNR